MKKSTASLPGEGSAAAQTVFIEELKFRQNGLFDEDFVRIIGIGRSTWSQIRSGKRKLGFDAVFSICEAYPELEPLAFAALREIWRNKKGRSV